MISGILDGYCQCGCGELTSIYRGNPRRFIAGHQARGACNPRFGVKLTEDIKQKISTANKGKHVGENNPFYGKHHSEESKKIMSLKGKGIAKTPRRGVYKLCVVCDKIIYIPQSKKDKIIYCSNECKNYDYKTRFSSEDNPFYGKHHSEETKEKLRKASTIQRAKQFVLPSKPEKQIHDELLKENIEFETEKLINDKFCVDIFIPKYNLIIYIDGCYWHACPIHCPNAKKPNTDNARIPYLTKCGYNVEILWEHDIKAGSERLIKNICNKYNAQT